MLDAQAKNGRSMCFGGDAQHSPQLRTLCEGPCKGLFPEISPLKALKNAACAFTL